MQLRDATPADAEAVAAVARASWHAAYDDVLGPEAVDATVDDWYDPDDLREQVHDGVFLVAEEDEVVGFAQGGPAREPERDAFLPRLYVHPDRWGEGVGTALLGAVAERLLERGHERIRLEVFAENDVGRGFYESLGFEEVDRVAETFHGAEVTTLYLECDLADLVSD